MAKSDDQYAGVGFYEGVLYGAALASLVSLIAQLRTSMSLSQASHNVLERYKLEPTEDKRQLFLDNKKTVKAILYPEIVRINKCIQNVNKSLKVMSLSCVIPELKAQGIFALIEKRLGTICDLPHVQEMSNENFQLLLDKEFQGVTRAIEYITEEIEAESRREDIQGLSEDIRMGMGQALDICSIGYYSTAILIAGRTAEDCLNAYYRKLFQMNVLAEFDLSKLSLENKINKLQSEGFIDQSLYHNLSSIRINRNESAHSGKEVFEKSQAYLRLRSIAGILFELEQTMAKHCGAAA